VHIRHRPIDEIEEDDLKELIQYKDPETKYIDYKRELPKNKRKDTIDLLSDVSSFANTSGGHLIYGIEEARGVPVKPAPMNLDDPDKTNVDSDRTDSELTGLFHSAHSSDNSNRW